ncbi:MAG: alpha/beta hydrolase [Candidatus Pacebacteria bacterium]|nr:alpha/beta hydrolase [Candidatus Paceibacterota bacterium]
MQEKQIKIKELAVNYKTIGDGKVPIVLLHGWGVSSDKYMATAETILKDNSDFKFYIPDLPGFGKSEEPTEDWKLNDYVDFTKEFIKNAVQRTTGFELVKNILKQAAQDGSVTLRRENKKVILLAHSFGGRVAIKYAVKYPNDIEKLVLTGAAGVRHPLGKKQKIVFVAAKIGGLLFRLPLFGKFERYAKKILYMIAREKDYADADPRMKEVMKNALKEDLSPLLEKITVPTVLIWGENDHSTPLADGEIMHEKIADSKLFIIKEANHSAVYNNAEEFAKKFEKGLKEATITLL